MRVDRSRDRPLRHLEWRVRLLGVGAVLGLAGIWMDSEWMVNAAIGVLIVTFVLRFVGRNDTHSEAEGADFDPDVESSEAEPDLESSRANEPGAERGEGA